MKGDNVSLVQSYKSVQSILCNTHINRGKVLARLLFWQCRKAFNLFPFEQIISQSRIMARDKSCAVSALIYTQGLYNYNNMKLLQMVLQGGGAMFDIGANIGSYTLLTSEQGKALVFAFEPHPATFRVLNENVKLNSRTNVKLFNVALGSTNERVFLSDKSRSAFNHLVVSGSEARIPVTCVRVDKLCSEHHIQPQYVKIDVEGFEYDVLSGFGVYLSSVSMFLIEFNGLSNQRSKGEAEIDRLLKQNGFRGPWYCDFDSRTLDSDGYLRAEDCLYFSEPFLHAIQKIGFSIRESSQSS